MIRLFKECARGGYYLKPGDIVGTIRQIRNDRHKDCTPITVTVKNKDVADRVLDAASNCRINGSRRPNPDDAQAGRFGFLRPSLSEKERKDIRDKKKQRNTPEGKGQAEIKKREYESRMGAEEWTNLVTEEYTGEEDDQIRMDVANSTANAATETPPPVTQDKNQGDNQDENLNTVQEQTEQEKEIESLRRQLNTISGHNEQLLTQNGLYRQRNASLENSKKNNNENQENQA